MTTFPVHSVVTAPEDSKAILAKVRDKFGFVPNLMGVLAEAPVAAETYATVMEIFDRSSLNEAEKQTILLTASHENECEYCMAAHSTAAGVKGVSSETIGALRTGGVIPDAKLNALSVFVRSIVKTRGWPDEEAKEAFFNAGYGTQQYLEVVVGVSLKTLSNYVNHATQTPLDGIFEPQKWAA